MATAKEKNREHGTRFADLIKDKHIRAQAERILPVLTLVKGTKEALTLDEVITNIARGIMALEAYPDSEQTANNGGITITRGPMDGYGIHLWITDIFLLHMDNYRTAAEGYGKE